MINLAQCQTAPRGIYHYCGDKAVNRLEFAQTVVKMMQAVRSLETTVVEIPAPENEHTPRPPYSVLSCDKIRALGYEPSDWQSALKHVVQTLLAKIA